MTKYREDSSKVWILVISCADDASYATTAKDVKPFYDIYVNTLTKKSTDGSLYAGDLKVTHSKTAGYQTATLAMGDVVMAAVCNCFLSNTRY